MNYYSSICIILLNITISNAKIVHKINELFTNIENQSFITIDDLNKLMGEYPDFIPLTLQESKYYTGFDASLCPVPYDENTELDDPEVVKLEFFNPRECEKPWTWTQQNQIIVPVPKNGTINKNLGELICQNNNLEIIQSYTYFLNTIESVGITLVDRFCLFLVEFIDRIDNFTKNTVFISNSEERVEHKRINLSLSCFKKMLKCIYVTFKQYFISTLPLDCILNTLKIFSPDDDLENTSITIENLDKYRAYLVECRKITKSKKNYAILQNDNDWKWDIDSIIKPNDHDLIKLHNENARMGGNLFYANSTN